MIHNFMKFLIVGLFLCGMGFKGHAATFVEAVEEVIQISKTTTCQWEDEIAAEKDLHDSVAVMTDKDVIDFFEKKMERKVTPKDGNASKIRQTLMGRYERNQGQQQNREKGEGFYDTLEHLFKSLQGDFPQTEEVQDLLSFFLCGQMSIFCQKIERRSEPVLKGGIACYPSTIPGNFTMPDIQANQENIWKTRTRWFNEMAVMKILMPFTRSDSSKDMLTTLKKNKEYGGFFTILEAYILDLVESPPLPDHWEYQSMVVNNKKVETALENANALQNQLKLSGLKSIKGQALIDGKMVKKEFTSAGVKTKILAVNQEKKKAKQWLQNFAFLKEQEEASKEALAQYKLGDLQPGQWRAEREAEERARAKKKKEADRKKAAAKRKKAAARLEKEQLEVEEAAQIERTQLAAAQREAERLEKERLEDEKREAQTEARRLKVQRKAEEKATAAKEKKMIEDDAAEAAEAMKAHRLQVEEDRRAKAASKAQASRSTVAAEEEVEEESGPAFSAIKLGDTSYRLMQTFWTEPTMKWINFRNLFASDEVGFSMESPDGSIRKFKRSARDGMPKVSFIVHEPHESYQSDSFGPSTLGHLRELFNRKAGWTLDSFARNSK